MAKISNGQDISKDSGTFTMDTARAGGYRMTVLLDKPYPQHPYNALLLNLDVFEPDKIRISLFECVYHKGELNTRHYPGDYQLFKDEGQATTR